MTAKAKTKTKSKAKKDQESAKKFGYVWVIVAAVCTATLLAATASPGRDDHGGEGSDDDGIARLSTRVIADKARQALLHATSLHVTVVNRSKGAGAGGTSPSAMDLTLDRDGNCMATLTFGADGEADVVRRGERVWLRMDDELWRAQVPGAEGRSTAEALDGRYVTGSVGDPVLKRLAAVCDLHTLQEQLRGGTRSDGVDRKGAPTTLNGTPVIPLTGEDEGGTRKTLWVATRGEPYALKYTEVSAGTAGTRAIDTTTLYGDYGRPVPLRTPPAADSVSVDDTRLGSLRAG
ncbi:hypothetical protein [Streptomyces sp. NPDC046939]|uniref:hypothetical protein n=1 Tax=Streptomyces sp. NPDC046939 TaxID=3155376 RepID=UPI0033F59430